MGNPGGYLVELLSVLDELRSRTRESRFGGGFGEIEEGRHGVGVEVVAMPSDAQKVPNQASKCHRDLN
jgi:hypothetical protein